MQPTPKTWCNACCKIVDTVVRETALLAVAPIVGAFTGAAHGVTRRRPSWGDIALKAGLGLAAGAALNMLVSESQKLACKDCGCTHLADHAAA